MAFTPGLLRAALDECLADIDPPATGLYVALSGGLDSSALLAALAASGGDRPAALRAIHVDHGLYADSASWAQQCTTQAAALSVPIEQVRVDARPGPGESPEAAARVARYEAIAAHMIPGEVLLTAHHADDQLETILLQWLRGGGLRAVAGMRPIARFHSGWHARPLLRFTRAEIQAWAVDQGLEWLTDHSNLDARFDRNYLRLEVLPAIRRRWPAAARTAGRIASQAAEALEIEAEIAAADLALASDGESLSLERLNLLPPVRQRWALRAWFRTLGLPVPSAATLAALLRDMNRSAGDRIPCSNWSGARVYRYRGRLHGVAEDSAAAALPLGRWEPGQAFDLGILGHLELEPALGVGLSQARMPALLEVNERASGERFRPTGASHHRPLRKWLQEQGVLPWRRRQLPLLTSDGEIVAIGDMAYGAAYAAEPGEPAWMIAWRSRPRITEQEVLHTIVGEESTGPAKPGPLVVADEGPFR